MFRVEQNVPEVYVNKSRDFQLLSRLYDLVFQSSRFSIDSMENISDTHNCNSVILPALGTKVGFFTNLDLPDNVYRQVIAAFPHIIKHKGSLKGLQLIANLFSRIENTKVVVNLEKDNNELFIEFRFNDYFEHEELLDNLLSYVCPTGMEIKAYRVISGYAQADITTKDSYRVGIQSEEENISNVAKTVDTINGKDSNDEDVSEKIPEIGFTLIRNNNDTQTTEEN